MPQIEPHRAVGMAVDTKFCLYSALYPAHLIVQTLKWYQEHPTVLCFLRSKRNNVCFVFVSVSGNKLNFQACMAVYVCFLLFMFFSAFWCLAACNYLHTCHKIRWRRVEDNMKHDPVFAGPAIINILGWWFYPITFQSSKACVGHNWKLLLISISDSFYWDFLTLEHKQTKLTKLTA